MALPLPPAAPQRGDRTTFSSRVDAFLSWLVAFVPQLNSFVTGLNAKNAGGANSFAFAYVAGTDDTSPGMGGLKLNSNIQNLSTILRLSSSADGGVDLSNFINSLGSNTSNVKASVRLQKAADLSKWLLFDITSVTGATGYFNLGVICRASSDGGPFSATDSLIAYINRSGDKGDSGGTPTQQQIKDAIGVLDIPHGGTGATDAMTARTNLGVPANAEVVLAGKTRIADSTTLASGSPPAIAAISSSGNTRNVPLAISNNANNSASAVLLFIRENQFGAYFGLDTDNQWKVGGFSMGNNSYRIWHENNFNPGAYAALSGAIFTGNISAPKVTETSDERKKMNWRPLTDAQLDALANMQKAGAFDWVDGSGTSLGGSAQEIRAIVPEAVFEDEDGSLTVHYSGLTFAMQQATLRRLWGAK